MTELPEEWAEAEIGELCDLINGRAFKPTDWTETGLPIVRIQNLNNPEKPFNRYDGEVRDRFLIDSDDLLFAWSGTPGTSFGAHVWKGGKAVLNQHIFNVKFSREHLDQDFFRHAINQKLIELIAKAHGGVGLRHVTKGKFEETQIPLPPLLEQRRIVRRLDTLSARTTTARTHLTAITKLVERYKEGVLRIAFRGGLTDGFRTRHPKLAPINFELSASALKKLKLSAYRIENEAAPYSVPSQWRWLALPALGELARGKSRHRPRNDNALFGGSYPFIQTGDVSNCDGRIEHYTSTYSDLGLAQSRLWPEGTLCITIAANIAETGILGFDGCFPDSVVGFIADKDRTSERYIEYFIRTVRSDLEAFAPGVAQKNINLSTLSGVFVPIPPLEEQREIVHRIETAFAKIDRLAAEAEKALKLTDRLDQRILAKAFAGELVPQDPNDEPAADLLARIRAQRAAAPKPKRGRRKKAEA